MIIFLLFLFCVTLGIFEMSIPGDKKFFFFLNFFFLFSLFPLSYLISFYFKDFLFNILLFKSLILKDIKEFIL